MLIASNRGAGNSLGFPDVCNTPTPPVTAPIPYPNVAMNAQATGFSTKVTMSGMNALNMGTSIPMTSGDEGGVAHPTIKGAGRYTMGNPKVFLEGLPGINLTSVTSGNNMNNPVGAVAVPSATNVFFTMRLTEPAPTSGSPISGSPISGSPTSGSQAAWVAPEERRQRIAGVRRSADELAIEMHPGRVGVLRLPRLCRDVPAQLFAQLRQARPEALVLDLRGNPGGDLEAALELADDFLARGLTLVTLLETDGDEQRRRSRRRPAHAMPLSLVVDRGTASAAEVLAGALQAHGRALVVGETTHGKGTVQRFTGELRGQACRYGTCARCLLPEGRGELDGRGITPDRIVGQGGDPVAVAVRALLG